MPSPTPRETRILSAYFGRRTPRGARLPSLEEAIRPWAKKWPDYGVSPLEAAAGSVVLAGVRDQLPQWVSFEPAGTVAGRTSTRTSTRARKLFTPEHLFTINWGDSGPGFSWPEAYWLATVPGYGRVVVSAVDSTDTWGYTEFAIGRFPVDVEVESGVREVITARWRYLRERGQDHWAHLFEEGLVSEASATAWAEEVWDVAWRVKQQGEFDAMSEQDKERFALLVKLLSGPR